MTIRTSLYIEPRSFCSVPQALRAARCTCGALVSRTRWAASRPCCRRPAATLPRREVVTGLQLLCEAVRSSETAERVRLDDKDDMLICVTWLADMTQHGSGAMSAVKLMPMTPCNMLCGAGGGVGGADVHLRPRQRPRTGDRCLPAALGPRHRCYNLTVSNEAQALVCSSSSHSSSTKPC